MKFCSKILISSELFAKKLDLRSMSQNNWRSYFLSHISCFLIFHLNVNIPRDDSDEHRNSKMPNAQTIKITILKHLVEKSSPKCFSYFNAVLHFWFEFFIYFSSSDRCSYFTPIKESLFFLKCFK